MMGHDLRYARALEALAAGELAQERAAVLWEHVRTCTACQQHYDALAGAQRLLASAGVSAARPVTSAPFEYRVVSQAATMPPRALTWWRPALAFATMALVLIAVSARMRVFDRHTEFATSEFPASEFASSEFASSEFAAREGGAPAFSVRGFCQRADGTFADSATCAAGAPLQLAYLATQAGTVQIANAAGDVLAQIAVAPARELQPLAFSAPKQRLYILLSAHGMPADDIRAAVHKPRPELSGATVVVLP